MKRERKYKPALYLQLPSYAKPVTPKQPKRLRPMSAKRRKESAEYSRMRVGFLVANPVCQRCGGQAVCVHHWAGRGRNYLRVETWRASCIPCNDFAKQQPAAARAENWIAPVGVYATG